MAKMTQDQWDPVFYNRSPMFAPIQDAMNHYHKCMDWPSLEFLNQLFAKKRLRIRSVPQGKKPRCFEEHYEPRIYLKGELQTRTRNWHDFFNALVWLQFSRTKLELNRLHYLEALQRRPGTNRTQLENAITLFDECGCIIVSSNQKLLTLIRNHQWSDLFLGHRSAFSTNIQCYVFGHAMYEKALSPYIGMTCQAILIHEPSLVSAGLDEIDAHLAQLWTSGAIRNPADLSPFPILGVPGWYDGDQTDAFYANRDYFRPKRTEPMT